LVILWKVCLLPPWGGTWQFVDYRLITTGNIFSQCRFPHSTVGGIFFTPSRKTHVIVPVGEKSHNRAGKSGNETEFIYGARSG